MKLVKLIIIFGISFSIGHLNASDNPTINCELKNLSEEHLCKLDNTTLHKADNFFSPQKVNDLLCSVERFKSSKLDKFYTLVEIYRPSAPWIIQELMELPITEFQVALETIIDILTQPQKRWFYFADRKEDFDQNQYWEQCLWQCNYYDEWLKKNAYIKRNNLFFKNEVNTKDLISGSVLPVLKYLEFMEVDFLYKFYAFYFDCLSHFFCQSIQVCYQLLDDPKIRKVYFTIAKKSLKKMVGLFSLIKSSKFASYYKFALEKYKELLAVLENEKMLKNQT